MNYKIGDTVVHWTYGVGKVIDIEEIHMDGTTNQYYVVEVGILKLWVSLDEAKKGSIRLPMERAQLNGLFEILRNPGQPLPDRYYQRKMMLRERMQKRTLEDLCHVIRDLTDRSRNHSLTSDDSAVLLSAEEHLIDEWVISLGIDRAEALRTLEGLLLENRSETTSQVIVSQEPHV